MYIVNVEGAVFQGNRWLIVRRSSKEEHAGGTLSLVGGKVDLEEDTHEILEKTLQREIYEEVGIKIKPNPQYLYSSTFTLADGRYVLNVVFLCQFARGTAICKSQDEIAQVYWLTYEQIIQHPDTPPWTRTSIQRAVSWLENNGRPG